MGLLSKLGGVVKEGVRNGAINALLKATGNESMLKNSGYPEFEYDANGKIKGINSKYTADIHNRYFGYVGHGNATEHIYTGKLGGLTSTQPRGREAVNYIEQYPIKYKTQRDKLASTIGDDKLKKDEKSTKQSAYGLLLNDKGSNTIDEYSGSYSSGVNISDNKLIESDPLSDIISLKLPDWSYADFINERAIWQKGLSSIFDEPAWFYFKIFFDFKTNHGLFGGLLNSNYLYSATNSAAKYLYTIRKYHKQEKPKDRINALYKFASILSYISSNAPWYFKSVKNLNNASIPFINDYSRERFIEIDTMPDAIDMRLSTLMALYNYACYDSILGKEIIPANLRKFNMTIVLFQSPLRYLHTSYITDEQSNFLGINLNGLGALSNLFSKKVPSYSKMHYKSMDPSCGISNLMSMHAYTFYGCEFSKETIGSMIPSQATNEKPFQLGNNSIKITYTTCIHHEMNEFFEMMFGGDGFYFNQYSNFQVQDNGETNWNGYVHQISKEYNEQLKRYNDLSKMFSNVQSNGTILGIIDKPQTYNRLIDATEALMNGLYENNNLLKELGTTFALGLLGSSRTTDASLGNIYGDYGVNSAYYKDKLEMLKNGVHDRTQAPYYYDPDTGVKREFHVDRLYSAYNTKDAYDTVTNFNVYNWLDTNTQKAASWINNQLRTVEGNITDHFTGGHLYTEQPYKSNPYTLKKNGPNDELSPAELYDQQKLEEGFKLRGFDGKSKLMVDDPYTWNRVEKPFTLNPENTIEYENNKAGGQYKSQLMTDGVDNIRNEFTQEPFDYKSDNAIEYENSKAGEQYKIQKMVDKIGNDEHEVTLPPFDYKSENAIEYEQNKKANT